jgi:hypothetical protein
MYKIKKGSSGFCVGAFPLLGVNFIPLKLRGMKGVMRLPAQYPMNLRKGNNLPISKLITIF